MRARIAEVLTLIGGALAAVGVGFVYWPAGLIVGGVALCVFGLFGMDIE